MSPCKDFSLYPPKKRPFRPISPEEFTKFEVDENEQPQDLSMKSRVRAIENTTVKVEQRKYVPYNIPIRTYRQPESITLDNGTKTDGLRLMSEVAAMVHARPSILSPEKVQTRPYEILHQPYQQSDQRSAVRVVLKERPTWAYHPYLSTIPSLREIQPHRVYSSSATPPTTPRAGSVSPSPATDSSASDGSPEPDTKLSCGECGRSYATSSGLARHQQFNCSKITAQTVECKFCSKSYTSVGALKMHVRTHTLPCKCHICGKAFSRPWLLQGHIRTHTGEKPFECSQCHRSFADRSNLRAHLQTHVHIKKYACRTCPKTFSRMSLLVKHQNHGCPGVNTYRTPGTSHPLELVC